MELSNTLSVCCDSWVDFFLLPPQKIKKGREAKNMDSDCRLDYLVIGDRIRECRKEKDLR